jgi:nicotinamide-nucleotide amidase
MGIAARRDGVAIFALPGPPAEMERMFEESVRPLLPSGGSERALIMRTVHEFGLGESEAAERLGELMHRDRHPLIGTTVSGGIVTAHVRAMGRREELVPQVEALARRISEAWDPYTFGTDGLTLPESVAEVMRPSGQKLATAESCTGGWLGKAIVDVADASSFYQGGWVAYANELKESALGVSATLLREHGAVSEEAARAMAEGAARAAGADIGLSVTGIAGPSGAAAGKPVGTVFIGLWRRIGQEQRVTARRFHFHGDRTAVRDRSVKAALQMLRLELLGAATVPLLGEVRAPVEVTA